jgi:hypothetical protein
MAFTSLARQPDMNHQKVSCPEHGVQDIAIACIHVCQAIDTGEQVGFFWSTETDGPRPDAWCRSCELWSREHPDASTKEWMKIADFQLLCVHCWDKAKRAIYGGD